MLCSPELAKPWQTMPCGLTYPKHCTKQLLMGDTSAGALPEDARLLILPLIIQPVLSSRQGCQELIALLGGGHLLHSVILVQHLHHKHSNGEADRHGPSRCVREKILDGAALEAQCARAQHVYMAKMGVLWACGKPAATAAHT